MILYSFKEAQQTFCDDAKLSGCGKGRELRRNLFWQAWDVSSMFISFQK